MENNISTTHQKFKTVGHHHFDFSYKKSGEIKTPNSTLMIVQTADNRWFIEQEFGTEYSTTPGIIKNRHDLDTEPVFYTDVNEAAKAAFALTKKFYPDVPESLLNEFLEENE